MHKGHACVWLRRFFMGVGFRVACCSLETTIKPLQVCPSFKSAALCTQCSAALGNAFSQMQLCHR